MGSDEKGTYGRVRHIMRDLIEPTIAEHRGNLVKTMGDGFLAMFDSPVEAVRSAIVIQQNMVGRNLELPKPHWIQFRMGINLGDVITENGDIYGDGVNIAARLEQMAEPGGVYISGGIYEQIKYKLVCGYQSLGDKKVKNVTDPIPIYRVLADPTAVARANKRQTWRRLAVLSAVILTGVSYMLLHATAVRDTPTPALSSGSPAEAAPSGPSRATEAMRPTTEVSGAAPTGPAPSPEPEGKQGSPDRGPESGLPPQTKAAQISDHPSESPGNITREQGVPLQPEEKTALLSPPPVRPPAQPPRTEEPEMVSLKGGIFEMGSNEDPSEKPVHPVTIRPFWIAKAPVTIKEWRECVAANSCSYVPEGDDDRPVSNVSWTDTKQFISWLSQQTGKRYRLPTEAEWEYAARAGTQTKYPWGNVIGAGFADCSGCGGPHDSHGPMKAGSFPTNHFGLYDMVGGVAQWVSDCWHKDYRDAPKDGSSWDTGDCRYHVLRGGSWRDGPSMLRVSDREFYESDVRYPTHGFRVARSE